jgi:Fur family ferric uptake transcriptional regulator
MAHARTGTPAAGAPDLSAAVAVVRVRGLRLSTSRRLVLEALYRADRPLGADEIAGDMDVAAVYRNLEAFEAIGLVRHHHPGHRPRLYERTSAEPREYLLCDECGVVEAIEPECLDGVRNLVMSKFGFEAAFSHFPISGRCARCRGE